MLYRLHFMIICPLFLLYLLDLFYLGLLFNIELIHFDYLSLTIVHTKTSYSASYSIYITTLNNDISGILGKKKKRSCLFSLLYSQTSVKASPSNIHHSDSRNTQRC